MERGRLASVRLTRPCAPATQGESPQLLHNDCRLRAVWCREHGGGNITIMPEPDGDHDTTNQGERLNPSQHANIILWNPTRLTVGYGSSTASEDVLDDRAVRG